MVAALWEYTSAVRAYSSQSVIGELKDGLAERFAAPHPVPDRLQDYRCEAQKWPVRLRLVKKSDGPVSDARCCQRSANGKIVFNVTC